MPTAGVGLVAYTTFSGIWAITSLSRIMPSPTVRGFALPAKAGFISHLDGVVVAKKLNKAIADDVARSVNIPSSPTRQRLLSTGATILVHHLIKRNGLMDQDA